MKLSIVISTHNRAESLKRTLESLKRLDAEVVVIDNESDNTTKTIAKSYGAKIYVRPNSLMLNTNKNYGFTKATGDWILCLDDDEVATPELCAEINAMIQTTNDVGFWIPRRNIIFGKFIQHGIWWPDPQLRLFKKGRGKYPEKHVHEYIAVEGTCSTLKEPYIHYNYDSLQQYLQKMQNIYTENEVLKYTAMGYKVMWYDALRFPLSDFIKIYFAQCGYKDGLHGLVLSLLQAFYSFIIFVKLWEKENFLEMDIFPIQAVDEIERSVRETQYWVMTTKMRETKNSIAKLWYRFLRKMKFTS